MERLERLKSRLLRYLEAERKILQGQSYSIGDRSLTRANLGEVRRAITNLEEEIDEIEGRGLGRIRRVVFTD